MASKYKIVVDRGICFPGHGKSIVDAINSLDKNAILRLTVRKVGHADKAMEKDSKDIKVFTAVDDAEEDNDSSSDEEQDDDDDNNVSTSEKKFSPAKECVRLLRQDYRALGLKSMKKRKKRECEKKIHERWWHLRKLTSKLSGIHFGTNNIDDDKHTFSHMYHYYACYELSHGRAALRRVPCNCVECDRVIRQDWVAGKDDEDQPRFQTVQNCYFESILGDENRWHIVDIYPDKQCDEDDLDEAIHDTLHHITAAVGEHIEVGNVGAVVTDDNNHGYYLVEFTGTP